MPDRMRILHMLPDFQIGGGQEVVLRYAVALERCGIQSFVCAVRSLGCMEDRFRQAGIPVHSLAMGSLADLPAAAARAVRLTSKLGIDLVHTNNTGPDLLVGLLAAAGGRVPVVNTLHSECEGLPRGCGVVERAAHAGRFLATRPLASRSIKHVVAASARALESWLPRLRRMGIDPGRTTVIHAGLDPTRYGPLDPREREALVSELGLGGSGPILMNVARLVPGKGQRWLIPLMERVTARWPRAKLLLIGEGEDRPVLESMIRGRRLEGSVLLLGGRADVPRLLGLADLFVFPSKSEGFGLAPLEAMATGKPVAAFWLPSLGEFVDTDPSHGCGVLVERGNGDALADAVLGLLGQPSRMRSMGAAGRRIVESRFTLSSAAESLARVYASALSGSEKCPRKALNRSGRIVLRVDHATSSSVQSPIDSSSAATSSR